MLIEAFRALIIVCCSTPLMEVMSAFEHLNTLFVPFICKLHATMIAYQSFC
jgi:hypothetical protein